MSRRRLRPDEIELWRQVTDTAHRLHPERPRSEDPKPRPKPVKKPKPPLRDFQIGEAVRVQRPKHDTLPGLSERIATAPLQMDHKTHGKLKRGKMVPEARIDLHGMTLAEAHPALTGFILRAHANGKRLVLVITGKGKARDDGGPIPVRHGVLRHQVPQWLQTAPLAQAVLQISEAHISHGGGGAFYVYLKRHR